jgi:hypothetical protein
MNEQEVKGILKKLTEEEKDQLILHLAGFLNGSEVFNTAMEGGLKWIERRKTLPKG